MVRAVTKPDQVSRATIAPDREGLNISDNLTNPFKPSAKARFL